VCQRQEKSDGTHTFIHKNDCVGHTTILRLKDKKRVMVAHTFIHKSDYVDHSVTQRRHNRAVRRIQEAIDDEDSDSDE